MTLEEFYGKSVADTVRWSLPEGYRPYRSFRAYFEREAASGSGEPVGEDGCCGSRWRHGPFRFEKVTSDETPSSSGGPRRLLIWQRIARTDVPRGWWPAPADIGIRMGGIAPVRPDGEARWSSHARRHLARWRRGENAWRIEEAGVDDFCEAYRRSDQDMILRKMFPAIVRDKARGHGASLRLFVARRGGAIEAGLAALDVPEARQSVHVAAFQHASAKREAVGVGLISHWHAASLIAGLEYLDLGILWAPGDPREWQGFSRFKSQFGVRLVRHPRPLVRLSGSR